MATQAPPSVGRVCVSNWGIGRVETDFGRHTYGEWGALERRLVNVVRQLDLGAFEP